MLLDWSPLWIAVANILVIPSVHLGVSWLASRLPVSMFNRSPPGYRVAAWEVGVYERWLLIGRWNDSLPDAAPMFGGLSKRRLESRDESYLREFAVEVKRGEWAHWMQALLLNVCLIWTPLAWAWVIVVYALLSNLPCIFNQRYIRLRLGRILSRCATA